MREKRRTSIQGTSVPDRDCGRETGYAFYLQVASRQYDIDDIILCEYGTTVVGLEMLRAVNEESAEEVRKLSR